MSNCLEMRVQAGSRDIFSAQRLSCFWQRRERLHIWAINLWTWWETKNCSELQSIARLFNFNCVLMQLIAPCNRAFIVNPETKSKFHSQVSHPQYKTLPLQQPTLGTYTDCLCVMAHSKVAAIRLPLKEQLIAPCNRSFTLFLLKAWFLYFGIADSHLSFSSGILGKRNMFSLFLLL